MSQEKAIVIIKRNRQRITEQRVALLTLLMDSPKACSQSEIEEKLSYLMDRATMYRSLNTFIDLGIISKLRDYKGHPMYIFNAENHSEECLHPHLKCKECDSVECLPAFPNEYVNSLEKYNIKDLQIVLEGVCSNCNPDSDS